MAHEFESGFFVKQPAWHSLGTVLEQPPTIEEALQLAGLDWKVGLQQLGRMTSKGFRKSNRWSIVRESDDSELGTVGKVWRPLQNEQAFAWFQPIVDAGLATLEAAGSLRKGGRVWVLAKVTGANDTIVEGDEVSRYILLAHGHDGLLAIRAGLTPVRVVCQNTLSAAIGDGKQLLKIFHHANAGKSLDAARDIITRANGAFDRAADAYRALAKMNVTEKQLRAYVDAVFPKTKTQAEIAAEATQTLEQLLARPVSPKESVFAAEVGDMTTETKSFIYEEVKSLFNGKGAGSQLKGVAGTGWGAYNAMTDFLTHGRGKDADSRLNNSFFGPEGARALNGALQVFLQQPVAMLAAA